MMNLQKWAGFSALGEAFIYISAFIFFGVYWAFPHSGQAAEQILFFRDNYVVFSLINLLIYLVFGVLLAILVCGVHERLKNSSPVLIQLASVFGLLWVGFIIATGMIASIGLRFVVQLPVDDPQRAMEVWTFIHLMVNALGGGNELVGGIWVLLLSIGALQGKQLSKALNYLGLFVGTAGICTVYPADIFKEIFGVSQIVWFIWLGIALLKNDETNSMGDKRL